MNRAAMNRTAELRARTRDAWQRSTPRPLQDSRGLDGAEATPGHVLVLQRSARFAAEWAVLDRDDAGAGRVLVVAADGQPQVGSGDLAIPASSATGALVLRCRVGGWVEAGALGPAIRSATLNDDQLARARSLRAELAHGQLAPGQLAPGVVPPGVGVGSLEAQEVDDDPEYQDWVRGTLQPAWEALTSPGPVLVPNWPGTSSSAADSARWRWWTGTRSLAAAATVLLAIGVGLFWRQDQALRALRRDVQTQVEAHRQELDELRRAGARAEDRHQRLLDEASSASARLGASARQQLEALERKLEQSRLQAEVRNPVALSLDARRGLRAGEDQAVIVAPDASHLLFFMTLEESDSGQAYRVEFQDRATGEWLWTSAELRPELRELRFGLPRARLPPGDYLLRILPVAGTNEPIARIPLTVRDG